MSDTICKLIGVVFLTASAVLLSFCRENLDFSVNTDVFSEEAIIRESCQQSLPNCPGVGLITEVITETIAMTTPECRSKANNPTILEPPSRMREGDNSVQQRRQDITYQERHEPVASILDEFI